MPPQVVKKACEVEIVNKIARGGNSDVFEITPKKTTKYYNESKKYAMKRLNSLSSESLRDVYVVQSLMHPAIVRLTRLYFDDQCAGKKLLVTMPIADGTFYTLHKNKALHGYLYIKEDIVGPLIDALQFMHRRGIFHLDIKPQNIIYSTTSEGRYIVKYIDLGSSIIVGNSISHGDSQTLLGTYTYMAPELNKRSKNGKYVYDSKSDMFSLGLTLLNVLVGGHSVLIDDTSDGDIQAFYDFDQIQNLVDEISNDLLRNLIKSMLAPHEQRITAEQALKHLYLNDYELLDSYVVLPLISKDIFSDHETINVHRMIQLYKNRIETWTLSKLSRWIDFFYITRPLITIINEETNKVIKGTTKLILKTYKEHQIESTVERLFDATSIFTSQFANYYEDKIKTTVYPELFLILRAYSGAVLLPGILETTNDIKLIEDYILTSAKSRTSWNKIRDLYKIDELYSWIPSIKDPSKINLNSPLSKSFINRLLNGQ